MLGPSVRVRGRSGTAPDTAGNQEIGRLYFLYAKQLEAGRDYDSERYDRLLQSVRVELESAARILHPGVARVYGGNRTHEGQVFIAQELINGRALRSLMSVPDKDSVCRDAVPVLAAIAHALSALHDNNVIHRDLKPENIIIEESGQPVLFDFGVAQIESRDLHADEVVGSLAYMAPEQAVGAEVDGRADIYALGAVAYEWFVGAARWRSMSAMGAPR